MAATVPAQFLFVGQNDVPVVTGFRVNSDGSLAQVAGSPFTLDAPARALMSVGGTLRVASEAGIAAFSVDKETGAIQPTDSLGASISAADPTSSANFGPQLAVLDSSGRFMYVVDVNRAELLPYRVEGGKILALSASVVPISRSTTSIAVVKP